VRGLWPDHKDKIMKNLSIFRLIELSRFLALAIKKSGFFILLKNHSGEIPLINCHERIFIG
jgi:hypothetical protein